MMKNIWQVMAIGIASSVMASGLALADEQRGGSGGHSGAYSGGYGGRGGTYSGGYGGRGGTYSGGYYRGYPARGYRGYGYGIYIGVPYDWYYPYPYYPYPYYYPYYPAPTYAYPPVVTAPETAQPPEQQENFWYHCDDPSGYYPYVTTCPGGWKKVVPQPPASSTPTPP
jgi:hypothetical protein